MEIAVAALVLFVSYTVIVFLAGYHWSRVSSSTSSHDSQATRISLLSKL
jgi:hypothetical protein